MKKQLSIVNWGGDSWLMNTPAHSYLYGPETFHLMKDLTKRNVGLWQLTLLVDLSSLAYKYVGCPMSYRPADHMWGFDAMMGGRVLKELDGKFIQLINRAKIDMPWQEFRPFWWSHMGWPVGSHHKYMKAAQTVGPGGDLPKPGPIAEA